MFITEVISLCVQVHSYDKEPNTEVTGRITLLLHNVATYVWAFLSVRLHHHNVVTVVTVFLVAIGL